MQHVAVWSAMNSCGHRCLQHQSKGQALFSACISVTHSNFCCTLLPSIFQAWQSWCESGLDGQPAAQDPTLPASFLLELGGGKIIDSKLFLFFTQLSFLPHFLQTSSGEIKVCLSKSQQRDRLLSTNKIS